MKTSNKLLIAFGVFIFIAPLLGMVVVSKMYYKDSPKMNMAEIQDANNQPFQTASRGRKAIALNKPFSTVNFTNGNNSSVEVHVNKSESYGVKIPEQLAGSITTEVVNGVLNINFKKELSLQNFNQRIFIVVYAPNLEKLSANNFMNLNCVVQTDSLAVDLTKCFFTLGNSDVDFNHITNTGDTLSHSVSNQTLVKSLKVMANNSNINISGINLNSLNVLANNDSEVNLDGSHFDQGESAIKNLTLETSGKNQVSIKNFNLSKAKSNFSDSTQLNIPTSILKLLLKD
ncbi:hypothetical protein ABIB40_002433 [Pedobacter sp. UYP30]|uniref:GIN domain-containing protein n=1 Tax=Pedobacter sp. UYP30 TaxID=1756400 RepID=UPI003394B923